MAQTSAFGKCKLKTICTKKSYINLLGKKPDNITEDDWNLLDKQALGVIQLTLSRNVAFNVVKEKTTRVLWRLSPVCMRSHQPQTKFI